MTGSSVSTLPSSEFDDDAFGNALTAGLADVKKATDEAPAWPVQINASEERTSLADAHKDSLYKGTLNVITMLEGRRDALNDQQRNDLNMRVRQGQQRLERVEAEKAVALDLVSSLNDQARVIQAAIDKDLEETGFQIMEEKGKYNDMIKAQRHVLETLR